MRSEKLRGQAAIDLASNESFWEAMNDASSGNCNTWVFCDNAAKVLKLSRFWELVEENEIFLSVPRNFDCDELGRIKGSNPQNHCFVFSASATIISCSFKCGKKFTILDYSNVCRSKAESGKDAKSRVDEMNDFILDLIGMAKDVGGGNLRYTIAGMSYAMYRAHLPDTPILSHDLEEARRLERRSYFGGQISHYYLGYFGAQVHHVDVRSMFPYIMRSIAVPTKLIEFWGNVNKPPERLHYDWSKMVAQVTINDNRGTWPVRIDGKVNYCTGRFMTDLAGPELKSAVESGAVETVHEFAIYETANIFVEFIDRMWQLRSEYEASGQDRKADLMKLMMNSLYGKFAQMSSELVLNRDFWGGQQWGQWVITESNDSPRREFMCLNWQPFEIVGREELLGSIPAISSFITSAARVYMAKLRKIAGQDNVLYQATDALIVNSIGLENLDRQNWIRPNKIGKLKIKETCDSAAIYSHNFYRIGDKLVCSGLKKEAVRIGDTMFAQVIKPTMRTAAFMGPGQRYDERTVFLFSETAADLIRHCAGRRVSPLRFEEKL